MSNWYEKEIAWIIQSLDNYIHFFAPIAGEMLLALTIDGLWLHHGQLLPFFLMHIQRIINLYISDFDVFFIF